MKQVKYIDLINEFKTLVENIRDSETEEEKLTNRNIAITKANEVLEAIRNNEIEIRKKQ